MKLCVCVPNEQMSECTNERKLVKCVADNANIIKITAMCKGIQSFCVKKKLIKMLNKKKIEYKKISFIENIRKLNYFSGREFH